MRYFVLGILFLAACSASEGDLSGYLQSTPESWLALDAEDLNARIEEAVAAKETWAQSPLMVTINLFGDDRDTRSATLKEVKNRGEGADATSIVYIRDGFLEDSVRGDWHQVELHRVPDGTWRVSKARVAYRCWRAEDTEVYRGQLCS